MTSVGDPGVQNLEENRALSTGFGVGLISSLAARDSNALVVLSPVAKGTLTLHSMQGQKSDTSDQMSGDQERAASSKETDSNRV